MPSIRRDIKPGGWNLTEGYIVDPLGIENESMRIIYEELGGRSWEEPLNSIIKRCIHTTADFDYADIVTCSEGAAERGVELLCGGADIVTDTMMAASGINKRKLAEYGGQVHCFIADEDVAKEAKERGITRAMVSMEKASKMGKEMVYVIGNAPTALIRLEELIREGGVSPGLIIGVPVGFVNVVESKELIMESGAPYIVSRGRKGGSNVAATICNALLYARGR